MRTLHRRALLSGGSLLALSTMLGRGNGLATASSPAPQASCKNKSAEEVTAGIDLTGKTILLTGCSSGIGLETLRVLVLRGARVLGLAPTAEKARMACESVSQPGSTGIAMPFACEHTDFASVAACADAVHRVETPLDGLICNAGINLSHLEQVNGVEKDFVVNHLAHFILVRRLLDLVQRARQGRIIVVGSGATYYAPAAGIEFDNLSGERDFEFMKMYGQSKLANALFVRELAHRLRTTTTTVNVVDPGVVDTKMTRGVVGTWILPKDFDFSRLKTVQQGAATTCYSVSCAALGKVSGMYFSDCGFEAMQGKLADDALAARLWKVSEQLTRPYFQPLAAKA